MITELIDIARRDVRGIYVIYFKSLAHLMNSVNAVIDFCPLSRVRNCSPYLCKMIERYNIDTEVVVCISLYIAESKDYTIYAKVLDNGCLRLAPHEPASESGKRLLKLVTGDEKANATKLDENGHLTSSLYRCCECSKTMKNIMKCGQCGVAVYCSKECQKKGWSMHKDRCINMYEMKQKVYK